ncbi:MAG TPA: hypothetical protein DD491_11620, partial [Halieaceae bacterium]|nr:hypothetical protein [Halieaceae bacterium]
MAARARRRGAGGTGPVGEPASRAPGAITRILAAPGPAAGAAPRGPRPAAACRGPAQRLKSVSHIAQTNIQLYEQLRLSGYDDAAVVAAARAYALAQPLFSARFRGSGRPFLCHLVGTASVLARDGASIEEVTAGLLHAAYDAGLFGYDMHRTVSPRKRAAVREAVGEAGEALVAAYTALPWTGSTLERLAASAARSPEERSVLRLRLANELDDLADGGLRYTGREKASLVDDASHRAKLVTLAQQVDMPHLAADLEAALASHGDRV